LNQNNFISKTAIIGKNTKIWNLVYIGNSTKIGDNVTVGSLSHIDYNVKIGNNVKIEGLAYIPPHTVIENDVFIGPGVVFTNDPYPPSKKLVSTYVNSGVIICANSTIKPGIKIGKNSVIGMGSVITKSIQDNVVVVGNPAKIIYNRKEYDKRKLKWENKK